MRRMWRGAEDAPHWFWLLAILGSRPDAAARSWRRGRPRVPSVALPIRLPPQPLPSARPPAPRVSPARSESRTFRPSKRPGAADSRSRRVEQSTGRKTPCWLSCKVSCELFESGFRWQATFFSREAQAYFSSDTTEVRPVNFDPDRIVPLPESEINFTDLLDVVREQGVVSESLNDVIVALDVRVNTQVQPVGPPGIPAGAAVYHLALRQQGEVRELFIDAVLRGNPPV